MKATYIMLETEDKPLGQYDSLLFKSDWALDGRRDFQELFVCLKNVDSTTFHIGQQQHTDVLV